MTRDSTTLYFRQANLSVKRMVTEISTKYAEAMKDLSKQEKAVLKAKHKGNKDLLDVITWEL